MAPENPQFDYSKYFIPPTPRTLVNGKTRQEARHDCTKWAVASGLLIATAVSLAFGGFVLWLQEVPRAAESTSSSDGVRNLWLFVPLCLLLLAISLITLAKVETSWRIARGPSGWRFREPPGWPPAPPGWETPWWSVFPPHVPPPPPDWCFWIEAD